VVPAPVPIPTPEQEKALVQAVLQDSADSYFKECDGYGPPSGAGNGLPAWAMVLGAVDARRTTPFFGEPHGIAACGAALTDMQAHPDAWMRKVSLLRARAIHRLEIGDATGALRDLDAADAAAADKDDIYYRRSLKLGVDMVRAYALRESGDAAGSRALALRALASRPYSQEAAYAALMVLGEDAPAADLEQVMRPLAQIAPPAVDQLFDRVFEHGRFDEAIELYPGVAPTPKLGDEPMEFRARAWLEQSNRADAELFWARESGRYAYALAAVGRTADARAALKAERDRYAAATASEPPAQPGRSVAEMTQIAVRQQGDLQIQTTVPPVLDAWARVVEARCAVNEGRADDAWNTLTAHGARPLASWATADALKAIADKQPAHAAFAQTVEKMLTRPKPLLRAAELRTLFDALPETETRDRLASYRRDVSWLGVQRSGAFGRDGYAVTEHPDRGFSTISFRGQKASFASLEDMALLRAADVARQAGKHGLIVLARRNINHTTTTYMYGQAIRTTPTGSETQLDVMFVDPASPPPGYQDQRWRIVDADAVYAALAPFYIEPAVAAGQ
jgi:hypothetical protein